MSNRCVTMDDRSSTRVNISKRSQITVQSRKQAKNELNIGDLKQWGLTEWQRQKKDGKLIPHQDRKILSSPETLVAVAASVASIDLHSGGRIEPQDYPRYRSCLKTEFSIVRMHGHCSFAWLPSTVTHLTFENYYSIDPAQQLLPGVVPDHITHLTLVGTIKFSLMPGFVPASVTHLSFLFNDHYLDDSNVSLDELIPSTVRHVAFLNRPTRPVPQHIQTVTTVQYSDEPQICYDPDDPSTFAFALYYWVLISTVPEIM